MTKISIYIILLLLSFIIAISLISISNRVIVFAAIIVAVLITSFISEKIALYILLLSMLLSPEFGVRGTGGEGTTIRFDDILLGMITFSWLAKTAIYKELGLFKKSGLTRAILIYIVICFIATGFGLLSGKLDFKTSFFFILKYIEYFILFFMVTNHIKSAKQIDSYITVMLITCAIVCLIALLQIPADGRVTAPFEGQHSEPNTLGGYLVLMLSITIGIYLTSEFSATMRIFFSSLICLIFITLLATQSRGSWFAFLIMYLTFIFLSDKRLILIAILLVSLILSPVLAPEFVKERIRYTFREEQGRIADYQVKIAGKSLDTSSSARIHDWEDALSNIRHSPVVGFGVTGWKFVDSQYIRTLMETGILGIFSFIFIIWLILKFTFRRYRDETDKFYKGLNLGFLVATVALLAHSFSANTFIIVRIMEPFWFLCGIVIMLPQLERARESAIK